METKYFASPELSKRLQELRVVSQFDYWWYYPGMPMDGWELLEGYQFRDENKRGDDAIKAYHFSDLLIPHNAFKIWSGTYYGDEGPTPEFIQRTEVLLFHIQQPNSRWQEWLTEELDKQNNCSEVKEVGV